MKQGKRVAYPLLLVLSVITALVMPSGSASATSPYDSTVTTAPNFVMACAGSSQTQDWSTSWFDKAYQAEATRKASDTSFDTRAMDYYLSTPTNIMVEMWPTASPWGGFTMFIANPEATISFGAHSWWSKGMAFHNLTELRAITVLTNSQSGDPNKDGCDPANLAYTITDRTFVTNGQIVDGIGQIQDMGNGSIFYPNNPVYQFINLPITYPDGYEGATIPSSAQPAVTYVAMGDSFSSGEGVPSFEAGTDTGANQCHRSPLAYPRLLQNDAALNLGTTAFVACAGATTSNVLHGGSADGAWGENPQVDALSADTEVVTITIGGNDVGFKDFATACTIGSCDFATPAYADIHGKITNDLPGALADTYEAIDNATSPTADVYVVGYPQIAPAEMPTGANSACYPLNGGTDNPDPELNDGATAYAVVSELNSVIQNAVDNMNSAKFHFVDPNLPGSPFIGHDWCQQDRYFDQITYNNVKYSFHPNQGGQAAYAAVVKGEMN